MTSDKETKRAVSSSNKGLLIRNYGLFWKKSDIHWGESKGNKGHLYGREMKQGRKAIRSNFSTPGKVDFRDQVGVYVLYDDTFSLIYVGKAGAGAGTSGLFKRLTDHRDKMDDRWAMFSWFGTLSVNKTNHQLQKPIKALHADVSTVLSHIEAILISASEPPLNRKGGDWLNAVQYEQIRDEEKLGKLPEAMIKELYDRLGNAEQ